MHERRIRAETIPRHIAVIMDGNGRWAERRGLDRVQGHRAGIEAVRATVRAAAPDVAFFIEPFPEVFRKSG